MPRRLRSLALVLVCTACADSKGDPSAMASTTEASTGASTELPSASSATPADSSTGTTSTTSTETSETSASASGEASGDATGEPEGARFCQEWCRADTDCAAMGSDVGFTCQGGRCVDADSGCTDSDECRVTYSGWVTPCDAQQGCIGQVCIDIGGEGRCATAPSDLMPCEVLEQTEITMPAIEGGELVVCANTNYVCKDAACHDPCEDDLACSFTPGRPHCDLGTGECGCTTDLQCQSSGVPGWTRCTAGKCGCGVDTDCVGSLNADVCHDGVCGCASITACTVQAFDGTTPVCEPL